MRERQKESDRARKHASFTLADLEREMLRELAGYSGLKQSQWIGQAIRRGHAEMLKERSKHKRPA